MTISRLSRIAVMMLLATQQAHCLVITSVSSLVNYYNQQNGNIYVTLTIKDKGTLVGVDSSTRFLKDNGTDAANKKNQFYVLISNHKDDNGNPYIYFQSRYFQDLNDNTPNAVSSPYDATNLPAYAVKAVGAESSYDQGSPNFQWFTIIDLSNTTNVKLKHIQTGGYVHIATTNSYTIPLGSASTGNNGTPAPSTIALSTFQIDAYPQ